VTILINEIHIINTVQNGFILHAADRRITLNGKPLRQEKKIFKIPYLNAGVGYFGLADINHKETFSGWLPNFINKNSDAHTLGQFAERLRDALNRAVNKSMLSNKVSGLHICGYNAENCPEFWIVRNSDTFVEGVYRDLKKEYYCAEEFIARDAKELDFGSISTLEPWYRCQYYINGDIRPFHHIWGPLNQFLNGMFAYEGFKRPKTPEEYVDVAKWKVRVIASFYSHFARQKIIGTPIDAFVLQPMSQQQRSSKHGGIMGTKKSESPLFDEVTRLINEYVVKPKLKQFKEDLLAMIRETGRKEAQRSREQGLSIDQICEQRFPNWHELPEADRQAIIHSLTDIMEREPIE
jgi:hypothetical protein